MKRFYQFAFVFLLFPHSLWAQTSGGSETRIVLRCGLARTSTVPLYVLDGVPMENGDFLRKLSPSDIKSIDILKDATAQAIYGYQAASGVILITTHGAGDRELRIMDFVDGSPVAGASLRLINAAKQDTVRRAADDSGLVLLKGLDLSADWQLEITATGYTPFKQDLRRGRFPARQDIQLSRANPVLDEVVVMALVCFRKITCGFYCRVSGVRVNALSAGQTDQGKPEPVVGRVYPNPLARGQVLVIPVNTGAVRHVQVLDVQGRIVKDERFSVAKGGTALLPTDARWTAGLYWVRVMGAGPVPLSVQTVIVR